MFWSLLIIWCEFQVKAPLSVLVLFQLMILHWTCACKIAIMLLIKFNAKCDVSVIRFKDPPSTGYNKVALITLQ